MNFGTGLCAGFLIGWFLSVPVYFYFTEPELSAIEMAAEYQAYRDCLDNAGKLRCHMTPQDFVRYYQLKVDLGIDQ